MICQYLLKPSEDKIFSEETRVFDMARTGISPASDTFPPIVKDDDDFLAACWASSSIATNSPTPLKRLRGFFSSALSTASSTAAGTVGTVLWSGAGGTIRCWVATSIKEP